MEHYAGIDVFFEATGICVVDCAGKIVREAKVASEAEALIRWFVSSGFDLTRIGLEAGPLSQWLFASMKGAGSAVELLETLHVRTALQTMPVKTDRNDARGIAHLMRLGGFRPVHSESMAAQETRALLTARKLVQSKLYDIEMSLRGILVGFGLKVAPTTPKRFARRIEEFVAGHATLGLIAKAMLAAHAVLLREFDMFEKRVRTMARVSAFGKEIQALRMGLQGAPCWPIRAEVIRQVERGRVLEDRSVSPAARPAAARLAGRHAVQIRRRSFCIRRRKSCRLRPLHCTRRLPGTYRTLSCTHRKRQPRPWPSRA